MAEPREIREAVDPIAAFVARIEAVNRLDRDEGTRGVYQVWHDAGWPQRHSLNARFGVETPFPQGFIHVADVQAGSLGQAVARTTDAGNILAGDGSWQPWEHKEGVQALVMRPYSRDTDAGDVIVDPRGRPHRYDGRGFRVVERAVQSLPSPGELAEDRGGPEPPGQGPERGRLGGGREGNSAGPPEENDDLERLVSISAGRRRLFPVLE